MSEDLRYNYTYEEPGEGRAPVLPPGDYEFEVKEIFDFDTSKAGNDKLPVDFTLFGPNGQKGKAEEQFVFVASAKWKIDSFLKATGNAPKPGERVNFNNLGWMQRARGRCTVDIEKYTTKAGRDGEKNIIVAFLYDKTEIVGREVVVKQAAPPSRPDPGPPVDDIDEDDIPF